MSEFDKMRAGLTFDRYHASIVDVQTAAEQILLQIRTTTSANHGSLFKLLFARVGENSEVRAPFQCEFGKTISIGNNTFLNGGVVMLDNADIVIGDNVLVGPGVHFYTPTHSLDYKERRGWEAWCKSIIIEDDVWIGGNVSICQGVTIGSRSVVAAGSVVTKDVPPGVLVGGSPAKTIKKL